MQDFFPPKWNTWDLLYLRMACQLTLKLYNPWLISPPQATEQTWGGF
jgi:hypothetical protein